MHIDRSLKLARAPWLPETRPRPVGGPARPVDNVNIHIDMLTFTLIRVYNWPMTRGQPEARARVPTRARPVDNVNIYIDMLTFTLIGA